MSNKTVYYRHKKYNFSIAREDLKKTKGFITIRIPKKRELSPFFNTDEKPYRFSELDVTEIKINPYNIHLDDDYEVVILDEGFSTEELFTIYAALQTSLVISSDIINKLKNRLDERVRKTVFLKNNFNAK